MEIDIRTGVVEDVDRIRFSSGDGQCWSYPAIVLVKETGGGMYLVDRDGDHTGRIDPADVDNLILALKKAKELGW